jgi:hypothetical protein
MYTIMLEWPFPPEALPTTHCLVGWPGVSVDNNAGGPQPTPTAQGDASHYRISRLSTEIIYLDDGSARSFILPLVVVPCRKELCDPTV